MKDDKRIKALLKRNAELSDENEKLKEMLSHYEGTPVEQLVLRLKSLNKEYNELIAELKEKIAAVDRIGKNIGNAENALRCLNHDYEEFRRVLENHPGFNNTTSGCGYPSNRK